MLKEVAARDISMLLLNGRLSERSYKRYKHIRTFIAGVLQTFKQIATISREDASRFISLGAVAEKVQVCGNVKTTVSGTEKGEQKDDYKKMLQLQEEKVFICGSTRTGEEEQLLKVYDFLTSSAPIVWLIAPRHIERVGEVASMLEKKDIPFQYYSRLQSGEKRYCNVVLLDTMGELAEIYSIGDYNFCGGSLVPRGGHNIVEPVKKGKPVYYGPDVSDFAEIADKLEKTGCGFRVQTAKELAELIQLHMDQPQLYRESCRQAVLFSAQQNRAVERQVAIVKGILHN